MNIRNIIIISTTLILTACSSQDEPWGDKLDMPVAAEVTASIGESDTRVNGTSWDPTDVIGISGGNNYKNVKYKVTDATSGIFEPDGGNGIFFESTNDVTFTAYYPFLVTSGTASSITLNTSDQSKSKTFDFLRAQTTTNYKKPSVKFNFTHAMTCLILQLKTDASAGFAASDVTSGNYKISGIKHNGTFNISTGTATANGSATADWTISATPKTSSNILTYSMILVPQTSKLKLTATIGGNDYACEFEPELNSGKSYTYTITVKKTGLEVSTCNIAKWSNDTATATGTAAYIDPFNGHPAVLMREASGTTPALYFADRNIGATSPEDTGLYFWWGDVVGHEAGSDFNFDSANCPTNDKNLATLYSEGYMTNGTDCNTATLTAQYDAAQKQWQGSWRLPTKAEIEWLINTSNCTREYVAASDGKPAGWQLTSITTNNSIFIPFSGYIDGTELKYQTTYGYYWTTTINEFDTYVFWLSTSALTFNAAFSRYYGYPLRPVATK